MAAKKATKAKAPKRSATGEKKVRQGALPGMERQQIKEVEDAGEALWEVRKRRMALSKDEKKAADALAAVMAKHGLRVYKDTESVPQLVFEIEPGKQKVTVKEAGGGEAEE